MGSSIDSVWTRRRLLHTFDHFRRHHGSAVRKCAKQNQFIRRPDKMQLVIWCQLQATLQSNLGHTGHPSQRSRGEAESAPMEGAASGCSPPENSEEGDDNSGSKCPRKRIHTEL